MTIVEPRETTKVLCELIESQMGLQKGQTEIYNQRRTLGKKAGIWVTAAVLSERQFAVNTKPVNDPALPDLIEIQTIGQQEIIQIDIMSADDSARIRRLDVVLALTGTVAQQACERYAMKISNLPQSFVDASEIEASARLNRYAITVTVLRSYSKARTIPTFTAFQNPPQTLLVNP